MQLKLPVLFINFKTYPEATGKNAVSLSKKAEKVAKDTSASIVLVVQTVDIRLVSQSVKLPVFAQHVDPISFGECTGYILPEALKEAGAVGAVLNHAENKRSNDFLQKAIAMAKEAGLAVMACAEDIGRAKQIASFSCKPDLVAVEPPELIGSSVSVSSGRPELITDSVKAVKEIAPSIEVVAGAGIKNTADVEKAILFGTRGVFVSSGIVKAKDQKKAIEELVAGFKIAKKSNRGT